MTKQQALKEFARQFWADMDAGRVYPGAWCALMAWQDVAGKPHTNRWWPARP